MEQKNKQTRWLGSDGYYQIKLPDGSIVGEHRLIWEAAYGPIPDGMQIHHKNHIRTDNRLCNLECVDTITHKRLHVGHWMIEDVWFKKCTGCGWEGPDAEFATKKVVDGVRHTRGNCVECERARVREKSRRRRELEKKNAH